MNAEKQKEKRNFPLSIYSQDLPATQRAKDKREIRKVGLAYQL
jgi:hypothetical protein